MDDREAFEAVRLAFHSDIPDALLRDVIQKAIRNHQDETASRRMSESPADAKAEMRKDDFEDRKKG